MEVIWCSPTFHCWGRSHPCEISTCVDGFSLCEFAPVWEAAAFSQGTHTEMWMDIWLLSVDTWSPPSWLCSSPDSLTRRRNFQAVGLLGCIVRRQRGSPSKSNPTNGTNCVCKPELRFSGTRFSFAKSAVVKYCHQNQIWHWKRFGAAWTRCVQPPDGLHCFTNYFVISEFF